jgi:cytoskeletal protein RodZ
MITRRKITLSLIGAVLIIGAAAIVWHLHRPHPASNGVIASTNPLLNNKKSQSSQSSSAQASAKDNSSSSGDQTPSGPAPLTPFGNFVSNHHPGGSAPTTEASTCNTTPGATCYIEFTNGNTVKKLDAETANANGAAIWYWDIKTAGLDSGSWTITAVATLNGQTKTANDSQPLAVQ